MKLNDTLFEDVSRLANGAATALSSVREQIQSRRPFMVNTPASGVTREEFEAVAAMAAKARATQDVLLARIEALEAQIKKDSKA